VPLQALFQALEALVHAVETLVNPVLVSSILILSAPVGWTIRPTFGTVSPASCSSLAPARPLGIAPASSSHGTSLYSFVSTILTVPGRDAT
jgi:hypothetical protein